MIGMLWPVKSKLETSLAVWWLTSPSSAGGASEIPGQGVIPHDSWPKKQNIGLILL